MTSRSGLHVLKLERLLVDRFGALDGSFSILVSSSASFALSEHLLDVFVIGLGSKVRENVFRVPVKPTEKQGLSDQSRS